MKYLEVIALDQAANGLCQTVNGVRVDTVIEAFSCKPGSDKKLYKSMDHIYSDLATSPDPSVAQAISVSPFGPLSDTASRKTFIFLVATLNAVFPDYDFSDVKVEEFRHEDNYFVVANGINTPLASVFPQFSSEVQESMWKTVDREIDIKDCEIYSFLPDPDSDPFYEDGYLWSFNYFFYNKKLKRVVFFHCRARRVNGEVSNEMDMDEAESSAAGMEASGSGSSNGFAWGMDPDMEFMMEV